MSVLESKPALPVVEISSFYGREVGPRRREVEEELVRDARGEYFLIQEFFNVEERCKANVRKRTRRITLLQAVRFIVGNNGDARFLREASAMLPKAA